MKQKNARLQPEISVIIPVYNVEEYVEEAIESILKQNVRKEIIIVDDQSTDNSYNLIKQRFGKNKCIKIYRNEKNSGQGFCRNVGLKVANGKYIFFIDSDDLLTPTALPSLYEHAQKYELEITVGWIKSFNESRASTNDSFFSKRINRTNINNSPWLLKNISPCNKLYLRSFIEKHKDLVFLNNLTYAEDRYFVIKSYYYASSIGMVDDIIYLYRTRPSGSSTQRTDLGKIYDAIFVFDKLDGELDNIESEHQRRSRKIQELKTIINNFYIIDKLNPSASELEPISKFLLKNENLICIFNELNSNRLRALINGNIYKKENIKVNNKASLNSWIKKTKRTYFILLFSFFYKAGELFSKLSKRKVSLIGEKQGSSVSDNSFSLFKQSGWRKNIYFITKKENIKVAEKYGRVLKYGSLKHFFYVGFANTYFFNDSMMDIYRHWRRVSVNCSQKKLIFLQHGVFGLSRACFYYDYFSMKGRNELPDIFCVSSEWEKSKVVNDFSFPESRVKITGLARHDFMYQSKTKKQILFIPTWRDWLKFESIANFTNSEYYSKITELNHELQMISAETGYEVITVLHHAMSKLVNKLDLESNVTTMDKVNVATLMSESEILITDYSSVTFDFVKMNKPVISYQFDKDKFLSLRGGEMVSEEHHPFVEICKTQQEVIASIYNTVNRNVKMEDKSNLFFKYFDRNNSLRIIQEATSL